MKVASMQSTLYTIGAVLGFVLLVSSVATDDTIGAILGIGSVILGVLGLEAQDILKTVVKSREVK